MHPELDAALAPLLLDLRGADGVVPTVDDRAWQDHPGAASCRLRGPEGAGAGVWIQTGEPPTAQVLALAEQVQEWAVEALWMLGRPTSWPACPHHPGRHPLVARAHDDRAVWVCPVADERVGAVGS